MREELKFWVPGVPQPGGSKRGFVNRKTGRVIITEDNVRSKDWRASVAQAAAGKVSQVLDCPLRLRVDFVLVRPRGHYRTGKYAYELRPDAPPYPDKRPDYGKLARGTEDSLKGIIWRDDSQIVTALHTKRYGSQAGAWITVRPEAA